MSINDPAITIIVPNHNHSSWIKDCLDSVSSDPYDNKQIVVIDDGSTDDSIKKIVSFISFKKEFLSNSIPGIQGLYLDTKTKISLISTNKSYGPSAARNTGIKVFYQNTDFFSFIDADDMHIKGKLKKTSEKILNNYGYVGVVYCDYENICVETGRIHEQYKIPFCRKKLLMDCIIPCHSLVAKYAIDQIGLFDEEMRVAEDYDFWIRISKKFVCYHVPEKLAIVRRGNHNSDHIVEKNIWYNNWTRIREKIKNEL